MKVVLQESFMQSEQKARRKNEQYLPIYGRHPILHAP